MARKLREALGMVSANETTPELEVKVPPVDKAGALVEAAESGFAAIQTLFADRNRMAELCQTFHRKDVYNSNVINDLRARLAAMQRERDLYMQRFARFQSWILQGYDVLGRCVAECKQVAEVIEHLEPPPPMTNNPEVPPLNSIGLPLDEEPPQRQFAPDGVPYNTATNLSPGPEDLRAIMQEIEQRRVNGHA